MGSKTKSFFLNFKPGLSFRSFSVRAKEGLSFRSSFLKAKEGQIMVIVLLLLVVVTIFTASMYTRLGQFILFNDRGIEREQGLALADAGLDYAIYKLNNPPPRASTQAVSLPLVPAKSSFLFHLPIRLALKQSAQ